MGAPQARLSDFARYWSNVGHRVEVLTGVPNHPTGVVHPGYEKLFCRAETVGGYRVIRTAIYTTANEGFVKKTLGHLSFMASALLIGSWRTSRADVIVVSSPQFFAIFSAWILARLTGAKFVLEVRDLWPGIFVELGVLKTPWIIYLLERLELFLYRRADHIVVVTNGFKDNIVGRNIPAQKVTTITNGVDIEQFSPISASLDIRKKCGAVDGQTLILYIGAHGISQGLDVILDTALSERENPNLRFCLVGNGARKTALLERAKSLGLSNLVMLDSIPKTDVNAYIAAADIALVTLRDIPGFDTFIPSKLFELMGAGVPVIAAVRGESADIASAAGSLVVPPEDASAMASAIQSLANNPTRCQQIIDQQRQYVEKHFNRETLAGGYLALLQSVCSKP